MGRSLGGVRGVHNLCVRRMPRFVEGRERDGGLHRTLWYSPGVNQKASIPDVEADERHQAEVDGFIGRNREALNASLRRSRAEVAKGEVSARTIDDVIADGRKRHAAD